MRRRLQCRLTAATMRTGKEEERGGIFSVIGAKRREMRRGRGLVYPLFWCPSSDILSWFYAGKLKLATPLIETI